LDYGDTQTINRSKKKAVQLGPTRQDGRRLEYNIDFCRREVGAMPMQPLLVMVHFSSVISSLFKCGSQQSFRG